MSRLRKWWRPAVAVAALVVVSQIGVSLLVRTHRVHSYLMRHLERAFGRPVEVAHFNLMLLGPRLDADQITVGEDPAFGNEYFLRAARLTARLRWSGLLTGHFEFGTLSISRPSLISGSKRGRPLESGALAAARQDQRARRTSCGLRVGASDQHSGESSDAHRYRRWASKFQSR